MGRISEHDRGMRTRLLIITPLVLLAHFLALVTLERVDTLPDAITLGLEGPPKFEPEISIVDNRTTESKVLSRHQSVMIVQDVLIEGEDKPARARGDEPVRKPAEKPREQKILLDVPGEYAFRAFPSHTTVPYRQDYVILKMVKPDYPPDALANAEEGYVLVEAYINAEGKVGEAYVRSSFGPRSFESVSIDAVKQFLFRPVHEKGKPVSFWVSFLVRFRLRR